MYLAKNEYEPCQIVLNSKVNKTIDLKIISNDNVNASSKLSYELFYVDYVPITKLTDDGIGARIGETPDVIYPTNSSTFTLTENQNFPIWILFNASIASASGLYNFTLSIGSISIPIQVQIFNFAISEDIHFYTQMNVDFNSVLAKYGASQVSEGYWQVLEKFKIWLIQHRITPNGPEWSGGLTSKGCPYITYNCSTKSWKDPYGIWGFEDNVKKYIKGVGFNNGHGWPTYIAHGLRNVD